MRSKILHGLCWIYNNYMGMFFLLVFVLSISGVILYGFGRITGYVYESTAVAIIHKGRFSVLYSPLLWVGIVLVIVTLVQSNSGSIFDACLFLFGILGFQACWGLGEFGVIQGHRNHHELDQDIPSAYRKELQAVWVKILMPGRWLVLWILRKRICFNVE